jgi:hypothetical protein
MNTETTQAGSEDTEHTFTCDMTIKAESREKALEILHEMYFELRSKRYENDETGDPWLWGWQIPDDQMPANYGKKPLSTHTEAIPVTPRQHEVILYALRAAVLGGTLDASSFVFQHGGTEGDCTRDVMPDDNEIDLLAMDWNCGQFNIADKQAGNEDAGK